MKKFVVVFIPIILAFSSVTRADEFPNFSGKALTNKPVSRNQLIGSPTLLIVTPSRSASAQTRNWADDLSSEINNIKIVDMLAIDVPFFITENYALEKAREAIPKKYWNRAWLVTGDEIKDQLNTPYGGSKVFVYVLDSGANIVDRFSGKPSEAKISEIKANLNASTVAVPSATQ